MKKWKDMTNKQLKNEEKVSSIVAIIIMSVSACFYISYLLYFYGFLIGIGSLLAILSLTNLLRGMGAKQELRLREYLEENR